MQERPPIRQHVWTPPTESWAHRQIAMLRTRDILAAGAAIAALLSDCDGLWPCNGMPGPRVQELFYILFIPGDAGELRASFVFSQLLAGWHINPRPIETLGIATYRPPTDCDQTSLFCLHRQWRSTKISGSQTSINLSSQEDWKKMLWVHRPTDKIMKNNKSICSVFTLQGHWCMVDMCANKALLSRIIYIYIYIFDGRPLRRWFIISEVKVKRNFSNLILHLI